MHCLVASGQCFNFGGGILRPTTDLRPSMTKNAANAIFAESAHGRSGWTSDDLTFIVFRFCYNHLNCSLIYCCGINTNDKNTDAITLKNAQFIEFSHLITAVQTTIKQKMIQVLYVFALFAIQLRRKMQRMCPWNPCSGCIEMLFTDISWHIASNRIWVDNDWIQIYVTSKIINFGDWYVLK